VDDAPKPRTLDASSLRHAALRPDKPAILCQDREISYLRVHRESNRAARALLGAGARRGDRIAYLGHESELFYELALACAKAGTVFVPVNWRLTAPEVDHILRDSGAAVVFVEREYRAKAEELRGHLPSLRDIVQLDGPAGHDEGYQRWKAAAGPDAAADLDPVAGPDDPVVQIYTSGTTGFPKGVVLAHRSFYTLPEATGDDGADWIDWREDDVSLISLPGFGIAGMGWFMHGFAAGATNVVMRMYVPEEAVRLIRDESVTITFVAPAMLRMMLDEPGVAPATFTSLRKVAYGAAPITSELLQESLKVFGCDFAQIYASTETGSVAVCLPPSRHIPGSPLLASAGLACPGNEVKIVDADGNALPAGEIGQVCIKAPSHMVEYWNHPEATAKTLVDGWLRMGDAGYLDENGYLFLGDRINDTIIAAGQNIYPAEVEKAIGAHPAVSDVAVVGVPDPLWGDAVQAFVVLKSGERATARELGRFLHDRIADYKVPSRWEFIDAIPRNPGGKILRRVLREQAKAKAKSSVNSAQASAEGQDR
jgi:acyl-CoA synthetase (AMP-forming)/AMP-acid ligase II